MKKYIFTIIAAIMVVAGLQRGFAEAAKEAISITGFQNNSVGGWMYQTEKGGLKPMWCWRVNFKINDPTITETPIAVVYLFNDKKELIGSLPHSKTDFLKTTPNVITSTKNLQAGKSYNLLFDYKDSEYKFKYALAVIGTTNAVAARVMPSNNKPEDFDFKEKELLAK